MGFDDGSAQVRNIRDPGQRTAKEHQEHMTTHRPYRSWCKFCVMGRGVNAPHRRSDTQEDLGGVPHVSMDCRFLFVERGNLKSKCLLYWSSANGDTRWRGRCWFQGKERNFPWIAQRAARFIDQLGHNKVTLRCDNEPAIEELAREIAQARQEGSQTVRDHPWEKVTPMGSSSVQWDSWRAKPQH